MKSPFRIFAAIAGAIAVLWLANLGALWAFGPDWQIRGQVGDSFGSINALFSGLAFAALIVTIWMQRHELALQREELALQREEMAKSREEVATQGRIHRAALLVAIAQAQIAAMEADIRAEEMDSESKTPGARGEYINRIRVAAREMRTIVQGLEMQIVGLEKPIELDV